MPPNLDLESKIRSHQTEKRTATVTYLPDTLNVEKRTVDFVLATDTPADFGDYYEVLGMEEGELRTARLDAGIVPVLDSHPQAQWKTQTIDDQFGVVIAWRREEGKIIGTLLFATDDRSERAFKKVSSGIVKTGSIGYFVYKHLPASPEQEGAKRTYRTVDWEIVEFSLVSIPRDLNAQARSQGFEKVQTIILTENENIHERNANMPPVNEDLKTKTQEELDAAAAKAKADETTRVLDIQAAVRNAGLEDSVANDLITKGVSFAEASQVILKKLADLKQAERSLSNISIDSVKETENRQARIDAISTAIDHRLDSSVKVEGLSRSFAGMSLFEMQKESLRLSGKDVRGMDKETVIRQAFQGTSDFPTATMSAISKKVKKGYDYASTNYLPLITETTRGDFKEASSVSLSDAPNLEKINEHGQFKTGTFSESKETYKIETYGKRIALTRQAIINDDLSLFDKIPFSMGVAGARLVHKLIWSIIKDNKAMSDGETLFSTVHKNTAAAKASLDLTVKALLAALRVQVSPTGEIMNYNPGYVIVGSDLEIEAKQLITAVTASKSSDVNIFANTLQGVIVEASLAAKSVLLTGRKEECDLIEVAWLNGQKGVNVRQRENADILGVEWDVFMDVGAAALDHRGLYKGAVT